MRKSLATPFWQNALQSLPAPLRGRYAPLFESAERWELRLDALIEAGSRVARGFSQGMKHRAPRVDVRRIDVKNA